MALQTRKPTGIAPWPIGLLGGVEKAGKSWACAQASASSLVGQTLWVGIGENDPDEYANVPGADFDIVVHDGSYRGILGAFRDAVSAPRVDEKPTLIVGDSMTRLWNLIVDNAQQAANRRAKGAKNANDDYAISPDLWNVAATQWKDVMDAIRKHDGPVLLTARLDEVMVMENGKPTQQKTWKVQGHKSLPYDVDFVVQMRERGQFLLTGLRSTKMPLDGPTSAPGWTVDGMWQRLGIDEGAQVGARHHSDVVADTDVRPQEAVAQQAVPAPPPSGRDWVAEAAGLSSTEQANVLWQQIPRHERTSELQQQIAAIVRAAAEQVDPAQGWAKPKDEETDWATEGTPQSEEDVAESMALEGLEPPAAESTGNGHTR